MKNFFYRVKKSDSVLTVSDKFDIPLITLFNKNNLYGEIKEGDLLYIDKCSDDTVYTVGAGETLKSVAEKFGISEEKLRAENNLTYLFLGVKIKI